jgi:hypothetical protein
MKNLILAAAAIFLPDIALAQPSQPQFCISPTLAQTVAATLEQDAAMLALLNDAAQEQQRQSTAVAVAVAKQKAQDDPATNAGRAAKFTAPTAHVPNYASPAPKAPSTRP